MISKVGRKGHLESSVDDRHDPLVCLKCLPEPSTHALDFVTMKETTNVGQRLESKVRYSPLSFLPSPPVYLPPYQNRARRGTWYNLISEILNAYMPPDIFLMFIARRKRR